MILSYITERMRMSKKSQLFGSWIPLRKTQGFAVDCPIQHKLGQFLKNQNESYFPNPLPIQMNASNALSCDSRMDALALAPLQSGTSKANGFVIPPISRQSSSSGSMGSAQLQKLLFIHTHKKLKSNGHSLNSKPPSLLGCYHDDKDATTSAAATTITKPKNLKQHAAKSSASSSVANTSNASSSISGKEESKDVNIVDSSDSSVGAATSSSNKQESENQADPSSTANNNTKPTTTLNLDKNLDRVANKQQQQQPSRIHPGDSQNKRKRSSLVKQEEEEAPEPIKQAKVSQQAIVRKKHISSTGGGQWS